MGSPSQAQNQQPQQVTTTTSNLPEYARPYFEDILGRAQAQSNQQYQGYKDPVTGEAGQRIAGFTPQQDAVRQNVLGLGASQQIGQGSALAAQAGLGALSQSQYAPGEFLFQEASTAPRYAPMLQAYQMDAPDTFADPMAAYRYMSPFMQSALDVQRREAIGAAKQTQLASDLGAARQGTYGGSRQLMAALERERQLGRQLGDIEATGTQRAFEQAQQQFNTEQQARQVQQQANLQSAMGTQQLGAQIGMQGAQQSLQAELANQQQMLEAQRLAEQSGQFGAQQGLAGLQLAGQMGQTLGNLGQYQQQSDLSRLQAQMSAAAQPQQLQQQQLDMSYADFLRQRDYPMEQLGYFSNILRGLPVGLSSTQTAYAQPSSMFSQIAGAGLGGLGMYNLLK